MEGLKQLKLSLITLYECYRFILKNPKIRSFLIKWLEHKKKELVKIDRKYEKEVEAYNQEMLSRINKI